MDLLVVGGTRFVGRHIVRSALAGGHSVTLLHRGSGVDVYPEAEHLHADRDGDLSVLHGRRFDATIDVCGYWPRQVRSLADALQGQGGHHLFVSSVSAYADPEQPGADERTPLATLSADDPDSLPMTEQTYGGLKVACESTAAELHEQLTIVRPTYVVGPYDSTDRFCWWLDRISRGGPVLAPGPADAPMQLVDAVDMGEWIVRLLEQQTTGAVHACSTDAGWTFGDMLEAMRTAVGGSNTELRWVDGGWLKQQGVDGSDLPLWSEGGQENALALDASRARTTGLRTRPVAESILETWRWMTAEGASRPTADRLSSAREEELLSRASA
jgi:2'-hydroxyisoflavone reductase